MSPSRTCALEMLHAQDAWLAQDREEIAGQIERGYSEAERGELIDGDEVRTRLAARKKAWLAVKRSA